MKTKEIENILIEVEKGNEPNGFKKLYSTKIERTQNKNENNKP